ncbi:hypothetical protein LWE61_13640 [Sphingobium sufflavum]|uniref:hypothetical protein n=1 Tax=Sphingobium sufflavum TaxID=1129547 RepID=UPI001F1E7E8B|nr:hypothetical protein [Sphingobium sufflavum]MCE7797589.1 hypothetical protein [Sphingobium sufflavum]
MDQPALLPRPHGRLAPDPTRSAAVALSARGPGAGSATATGRYGIAIVQLVLVLVLAGAMIVAPPAKGRILLVPLDGGGRDGLARVALGAGAALVDAGPFRNSLIVSGERSALLAAMRDGHMLVLRAAAGGCGDKGQAL